MNGESPFRLDRFEYEHVHLYYLPFKAFAILRQFKPTYLVGSRGTGKTTLLNALNWQEQLTNGSLQRQLGGEFSERDYIGVYLRTPKYQCPAFDRWLADCDEQFKGAVFALHLDLAWLEVLFRAVSELLAQGVWSAPPEREYEACGGLLAAIPELPASRAEQEISPTFRRLAEIFRAKRVQLERTALTGRGLDVADLGATYPLGQIGSLGRLGVEHLTAFRKAHCEPPQSLSWHFKVCLDEAEYLSSFQRRVLNTMVRLTSFPLSFVVSYVRRPEELSSTVLPGMSLQKADREILDLDEMTDEEFEDLADGVASVRARHALGNSTCQFRTHTALGRLDVNRLLHTMLRTSESGKARELLQSANQLSGTAFYSGAGEAAEPAKGAVPPIYQAYIVSRLGLDVPAPDTPRWRLRAQQSADIRKRMVGAYLCICRELGHLPVYAYSEMVFQMSDKCIRDYLAQLNEIFLGAEMPIEEFVSRQVADLLQDRALKLASRKKRDFLPESGVSAPREAAALVDAFASLTAQLQGSVDARVALRSSERGIFVLEVMPVSPDEQRILRILTEAAEAGFLKLLRTGASQWKFRVHCSLAAAYSFSYRGAYYPVPLAMDELVAFSKPCESRADLEVLVDRVAARLDSLNPDQLSLFGGAE